MEEKGRTGKREHLSENVKERMRLRICSGEWKPGDRLPSERSLAELYGVSRTVLREAVRALAEEQMLEQRGGATYVRTLSFAELTKNLAETVIPDETLVLELLEVRLTLEIQIVKEAARRWNASSETCFRDSLARMEQGFREGELVPEEELDFLRLMAEVAGNRALGSLYHMCLAILSRAEQPAMKKSRQKSIGMKILENYRNILSAVKNQDSIEAARLMNSHGRHRNQIWQQRIRNDEN